MRRVISWVAWIAGIGILLFVFFGPIYYDGMKNREFDRKWNGHVIENKLGEKGIIVGHISGSYKVRIKGGEVVFWSDYEVESVE